MMDDFTDIEIVPEEEINLDRFTFLDNNDWPSICQRSLSVHTMRKLAMVEKLFCDWRSARNSRSDILIDNFVPDKEFVDYSVDELCKWIPFFIHEIRRKDGDKYRAKTLFEFVLCVQTIFDLKRNIRYQFLKEEQFIPIRNALDNVMKSLQSCGLGNNPQRVDIVTEVMEESLWCNGLLGSSSPRLLLRTLVFSLGLNLGLRTGEHRKLRRCMFEVSYSKYDAIITCLYSD
jgi:hypothetical protein